MQLKVLDSTSEKLKLEIEGEGHTLLNFLESILLEDKKVEFASYNVPHPLISKADILIRTKKGKIPKEVLKEALAKIQVIAKELNENFKKALDDWTNNPREKP